MNLRLQRYKQGRLAGMNQYNAAIAAGYSHATANNHGKALEIRANIGDLLERQGLTDNKLVEKHYQLLESTKVVSVGKGGIEKSTLSDYRDIPDYPTQLKALEIAYKLKGHIRG